MIPVTFHLRQSGEGVALRQSVPAMCWRLDDEQKEKLRHDPEKCEAGFRKDRAKSKT